MRFATRRMAGKSSIPLPNARWFLAAPGRLIAEFGSLSYVFQMHQKETIWVTLENLDRILPWPGNPEDIRLKVNDSRIRLSREKIKQRAARAGAKLVAMRVMTEI